MSLYLIPSFQHFHVQIHWLESRNNHILSAVLQPNFLNKKRLCYKQKTQTTKNLPCSCARGNVLYKCLIRKRSIVRCCDGQEKDATQCFSILTTKLQLCWNQKWQFMPGAWLEYLSLLLSWPSAHLSVMLNFSCYGTHFRTFYTAIFGLNLSFPNNNTALYLLQRFHGESNNQWTCRIANTSCSKIMRFGLKTCQFINILVHVTFYHFSVMPQAIRNVHRSKSPFSWWVLVTIFKSNKCWKLEASVL